MRDRHDLGLLMLRLGLGGMFVHHGLPKVLGGPANWEALGHATRALGLDFAPTFFGFMAALAEAGGGLCLALGLLFRPGLVLMTTTMIVAAASHLDKGQGLGQASHAIESAIVFVSLLVIGPGRYVVSFKR